METLPRPCSEAEAKEILGVLHRNGFLGRLLLLLCLVYFGAAWALMEPRTSAFRETRQLGAAAYAVGLVLLVWAGACLARSKGRSGFWGLLGLGCGVGLWVLRWMPSRCSFCGRLEPRGVLRCPSCRGPL